MGELHWNRRHVHHHLDSAFALAGVPAAGKNCPPFYRLRARNRAHHPHEP
jgi:hypothetical protein